MGRLKKIWNRFSQWRARKRLGRVAQSFDRLSDEDEMYGSFEAEVSEKEDGLPPGWVCD